MPCEKAKKELQLDINFYLLLPRYFKVMWILKRDTFRDTSTIVEEVKLCRGDL